MLTVYTRAALYKIEKSLTFVKYVICVKLICISDFLYKVGFLIIKSQGFKIT